MPNRRRHWAVAVAVVVLALAAAVVVWGPGHSGRTGDVSRAFQRFIPCGTQFLGLGSRFVVDDGHARPGIAWSAARASYYGRCDPWWPSDRAVSWVEFESADDRLRASRTIGEDETFPYCVTATEVFFIDFETQEQLREFCREVGASEPVGEPLG